MDGRIEEVLDEILLAEWVVREIEGEEYRSRERQRTRGR